MAQRAPERRDVLYERYKAVPPHQRLVDAIVGARPIGALS